MPATISCDLAIAGGGLAGCLIALALRDKRPDLDVRLIEGGAQFGGNHLWSFFSSDVATADRWLVAPLVSHAWKAHQVRFPAVHRVLDCPYYSIESDRLDALMQQKLPEQARMTGRKVLAAGPTAVVLADGDRIVAKGVIDARGPGDLDLLDTGWQKFVGRELELAEPHGIDTPTIMDATVEQIDGYRFVYTLPVAATRMFVEDTYYSDSPALDRAALVDRIDRYANDHGWRMEQVVREEAGVLPVVLDGDFDEYWRSGGNKVAKAGMRAGLFHPTTGYSLPDAVRLATLIARTSDLSGAALHDLTRDFARSAWKARGFYRLLDRMLFRAAAPAERYRVLERFYRLDPSLIGRFYAGRSTMTDKARVLAGKPPVPIGRAIAAMRGAA